MRTEGALLMALLVSAGTSATAGAQAPEPPAQKEQAGLEDIVVTAQRREETSQDVPISISVATAEMLSSKGVDSTSDLAFIAPGLVVGRQVQAPLFVLRGVGAQYVGPGNEQPVALYIDGFYTPDASASLLELNNVDRVEVLKGPQGTLFGRNATGGLVQIVTKDPSHERKGSVGLGYGSYQTASSSVYATTGLSDTLAADIAFSGSWQGEGYGRNLLTGAEVNKTQQSAVRSVWLWEPSDVTTLRLALDYATFRTSEGITRQPIKGTTTIVGNSFPGDYQDVESNYPNFASTRQYGAGLKISHRFDSVELVSLTGFRDSKYPSTLDQDTGPVPLVNAGLDGTTKSITQELQLLSTTDSRFSWITGLFFFHSKAGYMPLQLDGLVLGSTDLILQQYGEQTADSFSGYAQGTWELTDATRLTVGARYTDEKHEMDSRTLINGSEVPGSQFVTDKNYGDPSGRISLDHRFNPDLMAYASVSRGFKAGSFSAGTPSDPPTKSETLNAYEIGLKAELMDKRLRLNSSLFHYDYKDMQVIIIDASVSHLVNAASSTISGAEVEAEFLPTERLLLSAGLTYLDTEYEDFPDAPLTASLPTGGNSVGSFNAKGMELTRAPNWSGNALAKYTIPLNVGHLDLSAAYLYTSRLYADPDNRVSQDSYGLLNAAIDWESGDSRWRASLWGKNLSDTEYYSGMETSSAIGDLGPAGRPRTYGVSVEHRF